MALRKGFIVGRNWLLVLSFLSICPTTALAADVRSQLLGDVRPYVNLRIGADFLTSAESGDLKLEKDSGNPVAGISIGADIGRYLGVEAALDYHKTALERATGGKLGDLSRTRATAELRLRYPLAGERLVPYVLAGAGAGFGEFSGREDFDFNGGGRDLDLIGVAGLGIDYFVADNIALTAQGKYLFGFDPEIEDGGVARVLDGDSVELTAGLRVYADHLGSGSGRAALTPARDSGRTRGYLAFKGGRALFTDRNTVPGVEIEPVSGLFGEGGIGVNFGRHWGLEFDANYTRAQLTSPSLGDVTGYPVFTYTLLGRYRYPLLADRLVPYFTAGGGLGFGEIGDRDQPFAVTRFSGDQDSSWVASMGAGVDYFVEDNLSLGVEARYTTPFETDTAINGTPARLSPDMLALTAGVRIYYP